MLQHRYNTLLMQRFYFSRKKIKKINQADHKPRRISHPENRLNSYIHLKTQFLGTLSDGKTQKINTCVIFGPRISADLTDYTVVFLAKS
jgi:hypothetical protein